jgi:outer membrane biosynthesis protein TonB
MQEYIYSNINWDILPKQDTIVKVVIKFSANEEGIIDDVKVLRGYNEIYDQEAVRVIKTIPEWDVYFMKGKHKRIPWHLPIVFSEENRKEYEK